MPTERELEPDERDELHEAAQAALARLTLDEDADEQAIVTALEERAVARRTRADDEEAFRLGALFAGLLEASLGFELVELTWPTGLVAIAAVEMDRSLVILPFHALDAVLSQPIQPAIATTFARLSTGERPPGLTRGGYAVLLP